MALWLYTLMALLTFFIGVVAYLCVAYWQAGRPSNCETQRSASAGSSRPCARTCRPNSKP